MFVFGFIVGVTVDENAGNGATAARAGNAVGELDGLIIRATVELLVSVGVGRIVGVGVGTVGIGTVGVGTGADVSGIVGVALPPSPSLSVRYGPARATQAQ